MSADFELKWEWPADRTPDEKILVQIDAIKKESSGFLGLLKSPSIADSMPDAQIVTGKIISASQTKTATTFKLVAPQLEIESIKPGHYAVMGIINHSICICMVPVERKDIDPETVNCL